MPQSPMIRGARRRALKRRVLAACQELIAAETYPSETALAARIRGQRKSTLRALRDELRREGVLDWPTPPRRFDPQQRMLPCRTPADLGVIWARAEIVRDGLPLPEELPCEGATHP